ncbi:MAG: site-specific DNA-methyltransferase [Ignavibacteriae bacterium]|nr:site-specific DNA-methyltransferase [Ignavibacteriota bacterium]
MNDVLEISCYLDATYSEINPLFILGESLAILSLIPNDSIDCCITSPPYWGQRSYQNGGIGLENNPKEFVQNLLSITNEIKRILKPSGSFWLNLGDTYINKSLAGIPWRTALEMTDSQNWILRNSIIWNKHKGGMDSTNDRLRNVHENIFHFVKTSKGYFYNDTAIRSNPRLTFIKNGSVVSATGVSGVSYKRKIELSTSLNQDEKKNALLSLNEVMKRITIGEITDFRMIIRDQHRTTHSDKEQVSGRAKELTEKGFYFLFYNPNGTLPSDVWDIIPEDTQKRSSHYAPYPEDLCRIPILSTCPENGIVLDPFCGTGTTNKVAFDLNRRSIGIDISAEYIDIAKKRVSQLKFELNENYE